MSRREDIDNAIWVDPEFVALTPEAKLLYLWSFTNPHCNMSGLYKIAPSALSFGTGLNTEQVASALAELAEGGFVFYVESVVWVRSRIKHLRSRSPQMAKSIANDLLKVRADHELRVRLVVKYASDSWLREELKRTSPDPIGNLSEKPVSKGDSDTLSRPSREGPGQGQGEGIDSLKLPEDFPSELRLHLRSVHRALTPLAERQGAKAVSPLSLVSVLMTRSHKPLVKAAYDFVAWADGQARPRKDVLAGYRNWLDRENDLAGRERLSPDGLPMAILGADTVVRLHRDPPSQRQRIVQAANSYLEDYPAEGGAA